MLDLLVRLASLASKGWPTKQYHALVATTLSRLETQPTLLSSSPALLAAWLEALPPRLVAICCDLASSWPAAMAQPVGNAAPAAASGHHTHAGKRWRRLYATLLLGQHCLHAALAEHAARGMFAPSMQDAAVGSGTSAAPTAEIAAWQAGQRGISGMHHALLHANTLLQQALMQQVTGNRAAVSGSTLVRQLCLILAMQGCCLQAGAVSSLSCGTIALLQLQAIGQHMVEGVAATQGSGQDAGRTCSRSAVHARLQARLQQRRAGRGGTAGMPPPQASQRAPDSPEANAARNVDLGCLASALFCLLHTSSRYEETVLDMDVADRAAALSAIATVGAACLAPFAHLDAWGLWVAGSQPELPQQHSPLTPSSDPGILLSGVLHAMRLLSYDGSTGLLLPVRVLASSRLELDKVADSVRSMLAGFLRQAGAWRKTDAFTHLGIHKPHTIRSALLFMSTLMHDSSQQLMEDVLGMLPSDLRVWNGSLLRTAQLLHMDLGRPHTLLAHPARLLWAPELLQLAHTCLARKAHINIIARDADLGVMLRSQLILATFCINLLADPGVALQQPGARVMPWLPRTDQLLSELAAGLLACTVSLLSHSRNGRSPPPGFTCSIQAMCLATQIEQDVTDHWPQLNLLLGDVATYTLNTHMGTALRLCSCRMLYIYVTAGGRNSGLAAETGVQNTAAFLSDLDDSVTVITQDLVTLEAALTPQHWRQLLWLHELQVLLGLAAPGGPGVGAPAAVMVP